MKQFSIIIRILIGAAVLGGISWYLVASVDAQTLWQTIRTSNILLLLGCIPVILVSHIVRGHRWKRLLSHLDKPPTIWQVFNAIMIGYAANTFVPRSGELLRPYALSRSTTIKFSSALGSVVVERVVDVLTLLIAIAVVLIAKSEAVASAIPGLDAGAVVLTLAVPVVVLAASLVLVVFTPVGQALVVRIIGPISKDLAQKASDIVSGIANGARVMRDIHRWPAVAIDSILMWSLYILPVWMILHAMPWSGTVDIADASILLVVIAIGVTIAPTPGALGVYQTFAQVALVSMFGATNEEGLAFGVVSWALNYGLAVIVGGAAFVHATRHGFSLKGARQEALQQESSE